MPKWYPHSNRTLYHRRRAELALGKPLPRGAEVHHADGSRSVDAPLVICQDHAYHFLLHRRTRVVKAGGNPNTDSICSTCQTAKPFSRFSPVHNEKFGLSRRCKPCAVVHVDKCRRRRKSRQEEAA